MNMKWIRYLSEQTYTCGFISLQLCESVAICMLDDLHLTPNLARRLTTGSDQFTTTATSHFSSPLFEASHHRCNLLSCAHLSAL